MAIADFLVFQVTLVLELVDIAAGLAYLVGLDIRVIAALLDGLEYQAGLDILAFLAGQELVDIAVIQVQVAGLVFLVFQAILE